jgi:hypothetical protein
MKQTESPSLRKTLALAATVAALGVSVGALPGDALAQQQPGKNYAPLLENNGPGMHSIDPGKRMGTVTRGTPAAARQGKYKKAGATQYKHQKGFTGGVNAPAGVNR